MKKVKDVGIFIIVAGLIFLSAWLLLGRTQESNSKWKDSKTHQNSNSSANVDKTEQVNQLINDTAVLFQAKDFDGALKAIESAIKIDKKSQYAYFYKGVVLYATGKYKQSVKAYDKALKIYPQFKEAYNNKGVALSKLGKYKQAKKAFLKAVEAGGDERYKSGVYYNLAEVAILSDDLTEVLNCLDKYTQHHNDISSEDYEIWTNALAKSKDKETAAKIQSIIDTFEKREQS